MKKLLILFVAVLMTSALSGKELTDAKYHEYLDRMEFLGSQWLGDKISEDVLVENKIQTRINTTLTYQVFFDSHSKFVTVKVSDLVLHEKEMQRRGIDTEQFIKRVIKFYLNSDVPDGDGTVIYK